MRFTRALAGVIASSFTVVTGASAEVVSAPFQGYVTGMLGELAQSIFRRGEVVSGSYTFDTSMVDGDPDPARGFFLDGFSLTARFQKSGFAWNFRDGVTISKNDDSTFAQHALTDIVRIGSTSLIDGSSLDGLTPVRMDLEFIDQGDGSPSLPAPPPSMLVSDRPNTTDPGYMLGHLTRGCPRSC